MENRNALLVDIELTQATGRAEWETAVAMIDHLPKTNRRRTVAADKAYATAGFIAECRTRNLTARVAQNTTNRSSAIDARTTRHDGHAISQRIRKRIEEPFGWINDHRRRTKRRYKGRRRNRAWFLIAGAVCNIIRIAALDAQMA